MIYSKWANRENSPLVSKLGFGTTRFMETDLKSDEGFSKCVDLVEKAYYFGKKAHDGQFRKSGEPYFIHPVAVANILCDMELDIETIIAGLLHDVVEDTDTTVSEDSSYEEESSEYSDEGSDIDLVFTIRIL